MDIATLTQLIGSLGFPIVACLAMAWFIKYQNDTFNATLVKNNELLSELIDQQQLNCQLLEKICKVEGI